MINKIWNWIKNIFKFKKQEMDEHAELYLKVPEPDVPVYNRKLEKINRKHKKDKE
tara:strand:- start:130 stop:294 length:165 start_codon:yes stop_codon:yes gene_type:complete